MPSKLIADRRLWVTDDGDQVVEDGDVRARFLLAGRGKPIPASVAKRLGIEIVDGRIVYPEAPELEELEDGEEGASVVEDDEDPAVVHRFGFDQTGGHEKRPDIEPAAEPEVLEDVSVASGEGVDDSDRNDEPELVWPGRSTPEAYLKRYPTGPKAELAAAIIAANAGADGAS